MLDHLAALEGEVVAMVTTLRAADLDRSITACPGWTVRDLTSHLVSVHRWALQALESTDLPAYDDRAVAGDPVEAYEVAAGELLRRLRELPVDAPAWTFDRHDRTAGFWRRRQLHELAVHRWDVEPYAIDAELAQDGVDEVLDFFAPRQIAHGWATLPEGTLRLVGLEREWSFGGGRPVTSAHGTDGDLLLGLWGRVEIGLGPWAGARLTP